MWEYDACGNWVVRLSLMQEQSGLWLNKTVSFGNYIGIPLSSSGLIMANDDDDELELR